MIVKLGMLLCFFSMFISVMSRPDMIINWGKEHERVKDSYVRLENLLDEALPVLKVFYFLNNYNDVSFTCSSNCSGMECSNRNCTPNLLPKVMYELPKNVCKHHFDKKYEWNDPELRTFELSDLSIVILTALSKLKSENKTYLNVFLPTTYSNFSKCWQIPINIQTVESMWRDNVKPHIATYEEGFDVFYDSYANSEKIRPATSRLRVANSIHEWTLTNFFWNFQIGKSDQIHSLPKSIGNNCYLIFFKKDMAITERCYEEIRIKINYGPVSIDDPNVPNPDDVKFATSGSHWAVLSTSFTARKSLLLSVDFEKRNQRKHIIDLGPKADKVAMMFSEKLESDLFTN